MLFLLCCWKVLCTVLLLGIFWIGCFDDVHSCVVLDTSTVNLFIGTHATVHCCSQIPYYAYGTAEFKINMPVMRVWRVMSCVAENFGWYFCVSFLMVHLVRYFYEMKAY